MGKDKWRLELKIEWDDNELKFLLPDTKKQEIIKNANSTL
jgi:hypothetical protein